MDSFVQRSVGNHPLRATWITAILIVVVFILAFYLWHYRTLADRAASSGFQGCGRVDPAAADEAFAQVFANGARPYSVGDVEAMADIKLPPKGAIWSPWA